MPRATNAPASKARRKRILKESKGFWGRRKNVYTVAKNAVEKALIYSYRDRRNKKRNFRALWIQRINAAAHLSGTTYRDFIYQLKQHQVMLDRKILAQLAMQQPRVFASVVKAVQA